MDWSYVFSTIREAGIGLAALLLPTPVLAFAALRRRYISAASPGLAGAGLFIVLAVLSGTTTIDSPSFLGYLPLAALLCCIALMPLSVIALRSKWLGLLHLLTIAGGVFVMFIAAMAISHDWL